MNISIHTHTAYSTPNSAATEKSYCMNLSGDTGSKRLSIVGVSIKPKLKNEVENESLSSPLREWSLKQATDISQNRKFTWNGITGKDTSTCIICQLQYLFNVMWIYLFYM